MCQGGVRVGKGGKASFMTSLTKAGATAARAAAATARCALLALSIGSASTVPTPLHSTPPPEQSDYISFRHHTYEMPKGVKSVALKECGPRFEMKLYQVRVGTDRVVEWWGGCAGACCMDVPLQLLLLPLRWNYAGTHACGFQTAHRLAGPSPEPHPPSCPLLCTHFRSSWALWTSRMQRTSLCCAPTSTLPRRASLRRQRRRRNSAPQHSQALTLPTAPPGSAPCTLRMTLAFA